MADRRFARVILFSLAFWLAGFLCALKLGATSTTDLELVFQLRLPRALLASAIGMGLAVAGAVLQALFTNPLCEPYTLGISSGASLGAVIGTSLGLDLAISGLAGSAFGGSLLFTSVLFFFSTRQGASQFTLLLSGVMLGFLGSSLVALWMALSDPNGIQGAIFWLMGDLSRARLQGAVVSLGLALALSFVLWGRWRQLDALLLGEEAAQSLGVPVASARRSIMLLTSLLVGLCVSGGGMIGFIGLVVPHFARKFAGALHFRLLPLSAIWGATVLMLGDTLARVLSSPYELPVGVVTALVGAPLFLWIMLGRREAA